MTFSNGEAVIPSSLKRCLSCLTTNKEQSTKIVALGHSTMQVTFPRTLTMSLQIRLLFHLHDHFAFKVIIDTLY